MAYLNQAYRGGDSEQRSGWWVHFDYDKEVIGYLKVIPADCREWDEHNKRWWVMDGYENALLAIFPNFEAFLYQPRLL